MTNKEAWLYAASWGSCMNSGDPGACLYGFDESFTVQSEAHRANCIEQMGGNREYVTANPGQYESNELEMIDSLIAKLQTAKKG